MAVKLIVFVSFLMAVAMAQQRPVPPPFTRSGTVGRFNPQLELEPNQQVPQPFRRVSVPLYRGRGFSLDGQEPKPTAQVQQQSFLQPRPTMLPNENPEFSRVGNNNAEENAADFPQPTRLTPQQQVDRNQLHAERFQQQQQHQQIERIQQQQQLLDKSQHEKQFPSFRPQAQIQPVAETQPQFVRKVVQRPVKRVKVTEETLIRSPEMIQRMKVERSEASDKQRAKKPVSQVLRRYRDDNPDGSITWGFENDDGTFKEEIIGVDCVTRGKYGYVDPEGVKREYSYTSGIPCDKNRKTIVSTGSGSSAIQEAQASDNYGYIDYTKNQYVMANGNTINLNGMNRNRARKPVVRKTSTSPQPPRVSENF